VLEISAKMSYWRNARDRIVTSQFPVWLKPKELPSEVVEQPDLSKDFKIGAILPKVVVAGTVSCEAPNRRVHILPDGRIQ
jgi:hypothetical protein